MKNLLSLSLLVVFATAQAQIYRVTDLGTLGGSTSASYGINSAGEVAGKSYLSGNTIVHAFLYTGGVMHDLGTLGGGASAGYATGAAGQAVGESLLAGNGGDHAFLYSGGTMHDLGTLGGAVSQAFAANSGGQVAGGSHPTGGIYPHVFLYSGGSMTDLGTLGGLSGHGTGINASGQVAGESQKGDGSIDAFLYANGSMHDLGNLGGGGSGATAINDAGVVVGYSYTAQATIQAFTYSGGVMKDLGDLGGGFSWAYAINNPGQIVGQSHTSGGGPYHAFLYSGGSMHDLNSMVDSSGSGVTVWNALGINDHGYIAAESSAGRALLLTPYSVVDPTEYSVVKGQFVSGSLSSLFTIDGSYLVARTNAARQRSSVGVTITLDGTSSVSNPSDLRLLLTSHVNSTNLGQKVEMYDYVASAWVAVDSTAATQTDSTETAIATNPGRFVQTGTNATRARISWNATGVASVFPWSVSIDQAVWNVSP